MAYEEINPQEWKFENEEDSIEGIFISSKKDVGINKSMIYTIDTKDGIKNVWGSAILDSRMCLINVSDKIKITYKGLGEKKAGKNAPKIFKVEVDRE